MATKASHGWLIRDLSDGSLTGFVARGSVKAPSLPRGFEASFLTITEDCKLGSHDTALSVNTDCSAVALVLASNPPTPPAGFTYVPDAEVWRSFKDFNWWVKEMSEDEEGE